MVASCLVLGGNVAEVGLDRRLVFCPDHLPPLRWTHPSPPNDPVGRVCTAFVQPGANVPDVGYGAEPRAVRAVLV